MPEKQAGKESTMRLNKVKRCVAACISALVMFTSTPSAIVRAEEYDDWKAEYVNSSNNEVSTYSINSNDNSVENDYIRIIGGTNFTFGTTGGDPELESDNYSRLLYGYPYGGTSYTTIQVDGVNTIFQPETMTVRDNSIICTDTIGDVIVTAYFNIVANRYTGRDDAVEFSYSAENTGDKEHSIGVRIMFDTMLGSNDSAPFRVPEIGDVTGETDLTGDAIPEYWQAFDSLTNPSVISQGTLRAENITAPDRVRFTDWGMAKSYSWDYSRDAGSYNDDSAVCLYWNPKAIAKGDTISCRTYYGLASMQRDNRPPLAVALSGTTKLEVTKDDSGAEIYSPNPFSVTAYVQNIGNGTAHNSSIQLVLPDGLHIAEGEENVSIGDIEPGSAQRQISWKVSADPCYTAEKKTYSVIVKADNTENKVLERHIEIPAMKVSSIELQLDRSTITDGSNLNLKFRLINISDTPIALNQLHPRYYYIDESPDAEKQFNSYCVNMDKPYEYLPGNTVSMTKHILDAQYTNATAYFEFAFNSDEKLQPGQEVYVNAGINNASWSRIVASNDYSAVGDDSPAAPDYVSWKYMPVYSSSDAKMPIWGNAPEPDTTGMKPDLLVELDPSAVGGKGYMNLNIRITNNGLLPIDLGQTEIKYYYTNDNGLEQSVAGSYIGGRINNNYIGITDKAIVNAVAMPQRMRYADTYVSVKFAQDTGILNFEDYIDLNIQVYNAGWAAGDYTLENDHSYRDDVTEPEPEIQTFSSMARAAVINNCTVGMREAKNIVVDTRYTASGIREWIDIIFGRRPKYKPAYSAFKVGEGKVEEYNIGDYNAFCDRFENLFDGEKYNEYATGENITDNALNFTNDNLKAILESDILYVSGHGFDGGVIPIYRSAYDETNYKGAGVWSYDKILTTDRNMGRDFHRYGGEAVSEDNTFSLNMKDHVNDDINENLKVIIAAACSQLSEQTENWEHFPQEPISESSLQRWIELMKSNKKLKCMLGYYGTAPSADNHWIHDDEVITGFLESTTSGNDQRNSIYNSWVKANTKKLDFRKFNIGLLVRPNYEKLSLGEILSDDSEAKNDTIQYFKITDIIDVNNDYDMNELSTISGVQVAINEVDKYLTNNNLDINTSNVIRLSEVEKSVYNLKGDCIESNVSEYVFSFKTDDNTKPWDIYGQNVIREENTLNIRYDVKSKEIQLMD